MRHDSTAVCVSTQPSELCDLCVVVSWSVRSVACTLLDSIDSEYLTSLMLEDTSSVQHNEVSVCC